ncbi:hypothetical protein ACFSW8_13135 [Rubritalea tangerina]|uniref:CvpA family protein n=1 Tax=Rubritalea tangerina TaxID=430798 RepID=A0ABW4ZD61_9BACT
MAIIVIIACATLGFAKGALRLFYGFLCFVGTLTAGWIGSQFLFPVVIKKWPDLPDYSQWVCALACAIITFLTLKAITDFFCDPFAKEDDSKKRSNLLGITTGFAMGFAICLLAMYKLVDKGTRAEIDYWVSMASQSTPQDFPELAKLKHDLLNAPLTKQFAQFFNARDSGSDNLAKLAIMQAAAPEKIAALTQHPDIAPTLENPQLKNFLESPEIIERIKNGDTASILNHPDFIALLADPQMNHAIAQIDIEQALKLR